jgi:hypothetical protein
MSVTDFSVPEEEFDLYNRSGQASTVYLNDVFRESLKKARSERAVDVIIRCDSLPFIPGTKKYFSELFDALIGLIFDMSDAASKAFLYVGCEEESGTTGLQNRIYRNYNIRFHTNFSTGDEWRRKNAAQLSRCNEIISNYGGSFIVNTIKNTGCLFLITLPANNK